MFKTVSLLKHKKLTFANVNPSTVYMNTHNE